MTNFNGLRQLSDVSETAHLIMIAVRYLPMALSCVKRILRKSK